MTELLQTILLRVTIAGAASAVALKLAGGGAFAYMKFIKPKQGVKVSADPDDYDFEDEEYLAEENTQETNIEETF